MTAPLVCRRRAIHTLFCSSAALALSLRPNQAVADSTAECLHFFAIGDYGTLSLGQNAVAKAMQTHREKHSLSLTGMLLLGDNFYGAVKDGFHVESPRWGEGFEAMYPREAFDCPCHVVLGNHDYSDNPSGEEIQLAYAKRPGTRWTLPSKWYRLDLGDPACGVTIFALDSNVWRYKDGGAEQLAWLEEELSKPRSTYTLVMAHDPVYSDGKHGDTTALAGWGPILNKHRVHAYLCGHDHDMQHLELADQFTSYVISGAGGAGVRPLQGKRERKFGQNVHGFTHLQVSSEALTFAHHDAEGNMLHRFAKRPDGSVEIG
jgi:tartrate-resistant acid phosphatase type 5